MVLGGKHVHQAIEKTLDTTVENHPVMLLVLSPRMHIDKGFDMCHLNTASALHGTITPAN